MHRIGRLTLLATLLLTAAGCSSPAANAKAAATVEIRSFQFAPAVLEVVRGTIVTWTNRDDILHTATAGVATKKDDLGTYERKANGVFDGRMDGAATTYSFTFNETGEFSYFCDRHAHMTGKVVVR